MKKSIKLLAVFILLMTCIFFVSEPVYAVETDEKEIFYIEQENVSEYIVQVGGLLQTEDDSRMQAPKRLLSDGAGANTLEAKEALYQGLMNHEEVISLLSYGLTGNEIRVLYPEVLNENPELIYLTGEFSWSYLSNGTVKDVIPRYNSYTIDDRENLIALCQSVVSDIPDVMTDEQKLLCLHDYIVTHCEYDNSLTKFNAYNCLVEGSSVCQGYALAFCLLGKYAGIDIKLVTSSAQGHAWNIVQIDGMDYFVDVTWDDPSGDWYELYCGHANLLRSRDGMLETGHNAGKDWTANGIGNVYYSGINSTKYDSYYWVDVITPIPCIEGTYAYAKKGTFDKVFLRSFNGEEISVSIPESFIWHVWKKNSYYTTNFSSFTSCGNVFCFSTPNKIYQMNTMGEYQVIYELNSEECSRGYIYGIRKNATGLNYWIGTDCYGVAYEKMQLELNKMEPQIAEIRNFVTRMYENCLYREPDESGLNGWTGQLAGGYMDGAAIAEQFVFSSELLSHNLSDEDFVEMLYQAMMGRASDAAGKSGWVAQLKNSYMTRSEVTKSFVESTEFSNICSSYGIERGTYDVTVASIEHFVTRFYTLCLERSTDQTGLYGWVGNLKSGEMNGAQIAEAFFFSEEFEEKKVSDEKYIDTLYMTLMNRPADEAGKKGYLSQMKAGYISRWYVMKVFIESAEFSGICEEYRIERGTLKATD